MDFVENHVMLLTRLRNLCKVWNWSTIFFFFFFFFFFFWIIVTFNSCDFQRFWKKEFSSFPKTNFSLLFPSTKVCLQLGNFPSCGNKLQDVHSVDSTFRDIFLPLQQLPTLSSSEISMLKFLWQFLFTLFYSFKVPPFISAHKNKINSVKYWRLLTLILKSSWHQIFRENDLAGMIIY